MKKLLASLVVFSFLLVGCGGSSSEEFEVALVTDAGDINDKSFNQSAWEAVEQYQKDHDATIKYYKPASFDDAGYKSQIEEAVENGAKIIVCPGFKFCNAIGELQDKYKDVKFILIDATPTVPDEKDSTKSNPVDPGDNVYCALYTETQPGYLAGYAAVKAGHTKLGFMGGIADNVAYMLISAVIFAMFHINSLKQSGFMPEISNLLIYFILGMGCAYVYLRTNNIVSAIVLHMFWNVSIVGGIISGIAHR